VNPQGDRPLATGINWDLVRVAHLGAPDEEHIRLSAVVALSPRETVEAAGVEQHDAIAQPPGFGLSSDELAFSIEDHVVPLVIAERERDTVASLNQVREDDGLGHLSDCFRICHKQLEHLFYSDVDFAAS
jgi:hypothetical protein